MINYWKSAQTPKPGEKPKVQENKPDWMAGIRAVNPIGWIPTAARSISDSLVSNYYQPRIEAQNQRQRVLDNQLLAASQKSRRPVPQIYGTGQQDLEQDVLNRNLTTPEEAKNAAIAAMGTAMMGYTPFAKFPAGSTGRLITNKVASEAVKNAIPRLAASSAGKRFLGYGALRGVENAVPGIVVNAATGESLENTAKRAGTDFAAGFIFNSALSPKQTYQAGRNAVKSGVENVRINKTAIPTLDAPLPERNVIARGKQGQPISEAYVPHTIEIPNAEAEFYFRNGRFPKKGEVAPTSFDTKGITVMKFDKGTGKLVSWSTDNPQFAQGVTSKQFSFGNTVRNAKPSELPEDLGALQQELKNDKLIKNIGSDQAKAEAQVIKDTVGSEGIEAARKVINSKAYKSGRIDFTSIPKYDVMLDDLKANHPYLTDGLTDTEILERVAQTKVQNRVPVKKSVTPSYLERGGKNMAEPGLSDEELASLDRTLKNEPGYQNIQGSAVRTAKNGEKITIRDKTGNPIDGNIQTAVKNALAKNKDKGAFSLQNQTPVRNIEDIFGEDAPIVKANTTELLSKNEASRVKWQDSEITSLRDRFQKLGVKAGSEEDALAFRFAEKRLTLAELKAAAPERWKQIKEVADTARERYDSYLEQINAQLTKYGYNPVPKRADYITHLNELNVADLSIGNLLNASKEKLPTVMSDIHMNTKPGRTWFGFGKPREGGAFEESVLKALDAYIPAASKQIFHTETIQSARTIEKVIKGSVGEGQKALSNFNSWYSEWVNNLAGKGSELDRSLEKLTGRGTVKVMDTLRRRTSANMVGANLSSALTNFIPLTQSVATTGKVAAIQGMAEAASAPFSKKVNLVDGVESSFLTRRFKGNEKIVKNIGKKAVEGAGWIFQAVDRFVSKSIVSGKYYEGLGKGLSKTEAMKQADDYAARLIADRSLGQMPNLYNSKMAGLMTQFQLEVNNQLSFLGKDLPKMAGGNKAKVALMLGQVAIYSYVYNNLMEQVSGRRPALDPIGIATDSYEDYASGNKNANKNLIERVSQNLPYVSTFIDGGRIPISAGIPNPMAVVNGESTVSKELKKPLWYVLPPTGGAQAKKTYEGVSAYNQGYSETDSGKVRYPIVKDTANALRTGLFGQYSTPEAKNYFRQGDQPLSGTQSEAFKSFGANPDVYNSIMQERKDKAEMEKVLTTGNGGFTETAQASGNAEIKQVGDKYGYLEDGKPRTFDTKEEAQLAYDKYQVDTGKQEYIINGDTLIRKVNGKVKTESVSEMKKKEKEQQYTLDLQRAKANDDLDTYLKLQEEKLTDIEKEINSLDPRFDQAEITKLTNQAEDIIATSSKYKGYGGFKKPKKPKRIPTVRASFKSATSKVPTAPRIRKPKLKVAKVKKPKVVRVRAPKI